MKTSPSDPKELEQKLKDYEDDCEAKDIAPSIFGFVWQRIKEDD
jgi:hypothetical protein